MNQILVNIRKTQSLPRCFYFFRGKCIIIISKVDNIFFISNFGQ